MKRYLIILAICGSVYADDDFDYRDPLGRHKRERETRIVYVHDDDECEDDGGQDVIITSGVSRDVRVITSGQIIDQRR